ncbi:hypothetical protein [Malacoplasma penetrans HF-2]|uniref:Uncharacterized protein n=2 Tax=Malacoplasma penetrans (strain HF-2) TaxID=272633 RepID=Q8EWB0_MALP2|nr:hypothetical protein [Malacoplasma penetrans HF-2]
MGMSRFRHEWLIFKCSRVSPLQLSRLINAKNNKNEAVEVELNDFEINALSQNANLALYA